MTERTLCSVQGCNSPSDRLGLCTAHYMRARRNGGDPIAGRTPPGAPLAFLREAVQSDTDDCILWPFNTGKVGYGFLKFEDQRNVPAHRAALMLATGQRPDRRLHAAHDPEKCQSKLCVNPKHLRWASPSENERDKFRDGSYRIHNALFSDEQVRFIRSSTARGVDLAKMFNTGRAVICSIRKRRTYSRVD
jgi:hypothetical protein